MLSVNFCTRRTRGTITAMTIAIMASSATTKPAVITDSVQLLLMIFMTAQIAMIGDLIIICRPIATSIWICVMSFVVRLIRLGTENCCISY